MNLITRKPKYRIINNGMHKAEMKSIVKQSKREEKERRRIEREIKEFNKYYPIGWRRFQKVAFDVTIGLKTYRTEYYVNIDHYNDTAKSLLDGLRYHVGVLQITSKKDEKLEVDTKHIDTLLVTGVDEDTVILGEKAAVRIAPSKHATYSMRYLWFPYISARDMEKLIKLDEEVSQESTYFKEWVALSSNKEKWFTEGVSEGYYSAMAQVLSYAVVYRGNTPDDLIMAFELKRKDFLRYLDVEDIEEVDKIVELLPEVARNMWIEK